MRKHSAGLLSTFDAAVQCPHNLADWSRFSCVRETCKGRRVSHKFDPRHNHTTELARQWNTLYVLNTFQSGNRNKPALWMEETVGSIWEFLQSQPLFVWKMPERNQFQTVFPSSRAAAVALSDLAWKRRHARVAFLGRRIATQVLTPASD